MKTYFCLFLVALSTCSCRKKQSAAIDNKSPLVQKNKNIIPLEAFKGDTLQFLRENFVANKSFFIHKNIKTLEENLELPILSFTPVYGGGKDWNVCVAVYLHTQNSQTIDKLIDKKIRSATLRILFEEGIPDTTLLPMLRKSHGDWTQDAKTFFETKTVKDISMTNM
jgi:hypothetical protein